MLRTVLISLLITPVVVAEEWRITVESGDEVRQDSPIVATLPDGFQATGSPVLTDLESGQKIPAQWTPDESQLAWILSEEMPANSKREYKLTLEPSSVATTPPEMRCDQQDEQLKLTSRERPILQYNAALNSAPEGLDDVQARNGYLHPIQTPKGVVITDDFAPDHPHQRGVFLAWTDSQFEGKLINFWEIQDKLGRIEHARILQTVDGPVFCQLDVELRFLDVRDPSQFKEVLKETWSLRAYAVEKGFLFDLHSAQRCTTNEPLIVGPYHYGGLGIRGRRDWLDGASGFAMTTSEGLDRKQGNHSRPHWVDFSGAIQGESIGMVVFGHPSNYRFPQPVRLHGSKPYFCFAPMVAGKFEIAPNQSYDSSYRFYLYDGTPDPKRSDQIWQDYADPAKVTVTKVQP